ncbi:Transcriptional regulatory protein DevR (DosR) [compost metagenome]
MNDPHSKLDQEELNIMNMLLKGATYDQIADNIHMSRRTVDNYMKRIFEKMGVKNRLEAIEAFLVKGTKAP